MSTPPRVPKWIREFSYHNEGATRASSTFSWTNVFHLVPNTKTLYPVALGADWKKQFNDWNGKILLLAKDGCPPRIILDRIARREPQPWRYGQRELGDEMGWMTNERLYGLGSAIPGGKLYGSATANMLYDDPGSSRVLKGFKSALLQEFLQRVLCWVLESMPNVEWVACLGEEAWFLTCNALGNSSAARRHREHRDSYKPVTGVIGNKRISAFPLYHPKARRVNDLMEKGWLEFVAALSTPRNVAVDERVLPLQASGSLTTKTPRQRVPPMLRNLDTTNSGAKGHRIITATLPKRQCRIQFITGKRVLHTSPEYHSGNTWVNIIAHARRKRGGAPPNLPRAAVARPQVFTSGRWINVKE
jgi:hypothetical protein